MNNKLKLVSTLFLISQVSLSAFDSAAYGCGDTVYILKSNKKVKKIDVYGNTQRGFWTDEDDAAIIHTNSFKYKKTIEEKNGKYMTNLGSCEKMNINDVDKYFANMKSASELSAEKHKLETALLSQKKAKTEIANIDAKKEIEFKKIEEEKKARELELVLASKNREIEKEALQKRKLMEGELLEKEKADAVQAKLAIDEKRKVESDIKKAKSKFNRSQKRKLRTKKKELLEVLENFETKYQFTKSMSTIKISDDALDEFFDMMDKFEIEFPSMSPKTCGVYYDKIKDNLDKLYGVTDQSQLMMLSAGTLGLDANIYSCIKKNINSMKMPK